MGDNVLPEQPVQHIERQDGGLTVNETPQINAEDTVRMGIK